MTDSRRGPNWLLLLVILGVGVGIGLALRGSPTPPEPTPVAGDPTPAPAPAPRANVSAKALWQGTGTLIRADLNGDEISDAIGRVRYATQSVHVAAFDGEDGSPLWQSERLGDYATTMRGRLARVGDSVFFGGANGEVVAIDLESGETRWTAQTGSRVMMFCTTNDDWIIARLADQRKQILSLSDGQLLDGDPDVCNLVVEDDVIIVSPGLQWQSWDARTMARPDLPGIKGHAMLVDMEHDVAIAVGQTTPEPGVPVIAAGSGAWTAELSSGADAVKSGPPKLVTLAGDFAIAAYDLPGSRRLAAFHMETGERTWDVELKSSTPAPPRAVTATESLVLVSTPQALRAFNLADGAVAWTVGK